LPEDKLALASRAGGGSPSGADRLRADPHPALAAKSGSAGKPGEALGTSRAQIAFLHGDFGATVVAPAGLFPKLPTTSGAVKHSGRPGALLGHGHERTAAASDTLAGAHSGPIVLPVAALAGNE